MAFGRLASLLVDIVVNTRRFQSQLGTMQNQTQNAAQQMRRSLTSIGLAASGILLVHKAIGLTTAGIKESVLAFADLEKKIVDIQKVARFDNAAEFGKGFIQLAKNLKGVSFDQLGKIGGDLARLGVRGGAEGFTKFLEVAAKFNLVTGDIDERQAGEGLGRILQNFGKELNADEAEKMAAAINRLADDFSVTSGEIITITQKLSGFADTVGLTAEETLALVTLVKQTGISSEVTASTFVRLFTLLEKSPVQVAQVLGKSEKDIDNFVKTLRTKPIEAIKEFFRILSELPIEKATTVLSELELTTSRNAAAFLNAANRYKDFAKIQETATSIQENIVLFNEKVADSAGTDDAKIVNLQNKWEAFKASFADSNGVFADVLDNLANFVTNLDNSSSSINNFLSNLGDVKDFLEYSNPFLGPVRIGRDALFGVATSSSASSSGDKDTDNLLAAWKKDTDEIIAKRKAFNLVLDTEYRTIVEDMQNRQRFGGGIGLFEEPKFQTNIRNRFEAIAKDEKAKFDLAQGGAREIHKQIDLIKERRILEEIAVVQQREFNNQFKEELDIRIQRLNELESTRMDIIGMISPGGAAGGVIDRALRLDNLLKNMSPDFKMNGNLKDLLFKSVFAEKENLQPQIRGLTQAYTDAITDSGQQKVDEAQLKALQDLLEVQIENKELQKETIKALKELETGVI
jgi:TP901 family phage tail tape measure protein